MPEPIEKVVDRMQKTLSASLGPEEIVTKVVKGQNVMGEYLAVTNRRRVFVVKKATIARWSKRVVAFTADTITSIQVHTSVLSGWVVIHGPGYKDVRKKGEAEHADNAIVVERPFAPVQTIVGEIQAELQGTQATTAPSAPLAPANESDIPDQIRKLAELRDLGALSDDEFDSKKRELLNRL